MVHYVQIINGVKVMTPVNNVEQFIQLRDSDAQRGHIYCIRKYGNENHKHNLVQFNYSCLPNEDGTLKGAKRPSNSIGMDIDHIEPAMMEAVKKKILDQKEPIGLLMLEKSARGNGYHVVFKRNPQLSQEENLGLVSALIGVPYDKNAKDITRVFYATTASEEDLIFLSDELFSDEEYTDVYCGERLSVKSIEGVDAAFESSFSGLKESVDPATYSGRREKFRLHLRSYNAVHQEIWERISEAIEVLEQSIGKPVEGNRNNFYFRLCCAARDIVKGYEGKGVDFTECSLMTYLSELVPHFGLSDEERRQTLESALKEDYHPTLKDEVEKAVAQAKCEEAIGSMPPELPDRLPPLMEHLLQHTPEQYKPAVACAVFPPLATHLKGVQFRYLDNKLHEAALMNVLMAGSSSGKGCVDDPIQYILDDIQEKDKVLRKDEDKWKKAQKKKGADKDKDDRPDTPIQIVSPNMTDAAFRERLAGADGKFLYTKIDEITLFQAKGQDRIPFFDVICNAFDTAYYGAERKGIDGCSEIVPVRWNWNASTTVSKGKTFFRGVLTDGPLSRICICTIPDEGFGADMPEYGIYSDTYADKLMPYINRLCSASGVIECKEAEECVRSLKESTQETAKELRSPAYENFRKRALVIAYRKAMALYIAHGMEWSQEIADFVKWSLDYDLWCKMHFFGEAYDQAEKAESGTVRKSGSDLLNQLNDEFTRDDLMKVHPDPTPRKVSDLIGKWEKRGNIEPVDGKAKTYRKVK